MKQHEATQRTLQQLQRVEQERNQLKNKVRCVMPPPRRRAHYAHARVPPHTMLWSLFAVKFVFVKLCMYV